MRTLAPSLLVAVLSSALPVLAQTPAATQQDATQPPATQHAVLTVQGRGAQVYSCQPVGSGFQWVFQAPVARLFDAQGVEVGTHGDGPAWSLQDASSIQGVLLTKSPAPDAANIPWLLLKGANPQRTGLLSTVEYIRRSGTQGGVAPTAPCDLSLKGSLQRVPYTATYTFFSSAQPKP